MNNFVQTLRNDTIETLQKRVVDFKQGYRQNVAILGEELTGKTTLLKLFIKRIEDEGLIPVYTEILPHEFSIFIKRFLNSLFYNFLKARQLLSTRENLDLLIKRAEDKLPQSSSFARTLLSRLDKDKPENLFKELFDILEIFQQESEVSCVVIFDEFHHLKKLGAKNICQELGHRIMLQKKTLFIFTSSEKNESREILANDLSLLFGNFETLEVGMLDSKDSSFLIQERLSGVQTPPQIKDFLIHFTGGHPFYLKAICDELKHNCLCRREQIISNEILMDSLERLLFGDWGLFNMKFIASLSLLTLGRNKNDHIYILDNIAIGKNRLKDLSGALRKPLKEIHLRLNKLLETNLLSKNGSFYQINDRLMSFWLKYVHHEKHNSLSPDFSEQQAHFRRNIEREIDRFQTSSKLDLADRVLDLFNAFEGDDVLFERKKVQLSLFKEIKLINLDQSNLKIGIFAKAQDGIWLTAVKDDGILEQDVNEFIQFSKKYKHKMINKIIIGMGNIDRNAQLLAKESSILMWDTPKINQLLDIFDKPRIIRSCV